MPDSKKKKSKGLSRQQLEAKVKRLEDIIGKADEYKANRVREAKQMGTYRDPQEAQWQKELGQTPMHQMDFPTIYDRGRFDPGISGPTSTPLGVGVDWGTPEMSVPYQPAGPQTQQLPMQTAVEFGRPEVSEMGGTVWNKTMEDAAIRHMVDTGQIPGDVNPEKLTGDMRSRLGAVRSEVDERGIKEGGRVLQSLNSPTDAQKLDDRLEDKGKRRLNRPADEAASGVYGESIGTFPGYWRDMGQDQAEVMARNAEIWKDASATAASQAYQKMMLQKHLEEVQKYAQAAQTGGTMVQ